MATHIVHDTRGPRNAGADRGAGAPLTDGKWVGGNVTYTIAIRGYLLVGVCV